MYLLEGSDYDYPLINEFRKTYFTKKDFEGNPYTDKTLFGL